MTKDKAASLRFYPHVNKIKSSVEKDSSSGERFVRSPAKATDAELASRSPLRDQWLLEKNEKAVSRQSREDLIDVAEIFEMPAQSWSAIKTPPNGQLAFYQVKDKTLDENVVAEAIAKQTRSAQATLSAEAQRALMQTVLADIKAKECNILSLFTKK